MADEYIPMEFYTDDTIAVDLGEVMAIGGSSVSVNANFNQTDPNAPDYIIGRENIATKDDLTETMFFTEWDFHLDTPTDVTELVTYKPTISEAQDHFGYKASADTTPHIRAVWKQGMANPTAGEILPLATWNAPWEDRGAFDLIFANKDYKLTLTYQYDTSVSPYGDLLSVTALLTEEASIGDIETALDNIIVLQEALMVGTTNEVLDDLHEYAQNIIIGGDT